MPISSASWAFHVLAKTLLEYPGFKLTPFGRAFFLALALALNLARDRIWSKSRIKAKSMTDPRQNGNSYNMNLKVESVLLPDMQGPGHAAAVRLPQVSGYAADQVKGRSRRVSKF
jgi:hypothetical protein